MKVNAVIECEAGSDIKHVLNESTFEKEESFQVSRKYPFPYGFIPKTKSGDGDCLDCFVLTSKKLHVKDEIEIRAIGMFEQYETRNGITKEDHNILCVLDDEVVIIDKMKETLKDFVEHVWDHREGKKVEVGKFHGKEEAEKLMALSRSRI